MAKLPKNMKNNSVFISPTDGKMTIEKVVKNLVDFMNAEPDYFYRLVIVTDSRSGKLLRAQAVDFVTAVVIHRMGKGGRYFWQRNKVEKIAACQTLPPLDIIKL